MMRVKKMILFAVFCMVVGMVLAGSTKVFAGDFKTIYTDKGSSVKYRTVNGTSFLEKYDSGKRTNTLSAKKNGRKIIITNHAYTSYIHTNGNIVFYLINNSNVIGLRKINLKTGKVDFIRNFSDSSSINLQMIEGKYAYYCSKPNTIKKVNLKNGKITTVKKTGVNEYQTIRLETVRDHMLYFLDGSVGGEGNLMELNLKTKALKKINIGNRVVSLFWSCGNGYFLMKDGSGAGSSYLGLWDSNNRKFKVVTKHPESYLMDGNYIYYAENISGELSVAGRGFTVAIRKYNISTGKRVTMVKSLRINTYIIDFEKNYIKYYDNFDNNKIITKKW